MEGKGARHGKGLHVALAVAVLIVVLAGCGSAPSIRTSTATPAQTSANPAHQTGPDATTTGRSAAPTITATPEGMILPGLGDAAGWREIRWSGSVGAGSIGPTMKWRNGWIFQTGGGNGEAAFYASTDGATWQRVASDLTGARLVAVLADRLIAGSYATPTALWTSADAKSWRVMAPSGFFTDQLASMASGNEALVALSVHGAVLWSPDGLAWRPPEGLKALREAARVIFTQGRFVLFGRQQDPRFPKIGTARAGVIFVSSDGQHWSAAEGDLGYDGSTWTAVSVGRDGLLAELATSDHLSARWFHSSNGLAWQSIDRFPPIGAMEWAGDPPHNCPDGFLASNGDRMLAYKWNGQAWTSSDGINWAALSMPSSPILDTWHASAGYCAAVAPDVQILPRGILLQGGGRDVYGAAS